MSESERGAVILQVTGDTVDTLSSCPNSVSKQCAMIDRLGVLSGIDQKLKGPITSVDMLKDSDHILFVHIQKSEALNTEEVITGYLKVGYKRLYFYTVKGKVVEMDQVPVCLDFFVDPDYQRSGIGKVLFDFMLEGLSRNASDFAYDRPSSKLTPFLWKHYGLSYQDLQPNRYAIYPREGFPLE